MTAGLPGVGIGGIFYLASAILMPVRSLIAVLDGRAHEARWSLAWRQASLAAGILGTLWATGWLLGWVITAFVPAGTTTATLAGVSPGQVHNVVKTSALLLSFGTLAGVLLLVQVLRMALPVKVTARNVPAERRTLARPAA